MKRSPVRHLSEVDGLSIGDCVPLPPPEKRKISPARWVDDKASSPKGVFRNGRGGA